MTNPVKLGNKWFIEYGGIIEDVTEQYIKTNYPSVYKAAKIDEIVNYVQGKVKSGAISKRTGTTLTKKLQDLRNG